MWFVSAIITVLAWGAADMFYKKGNDIEERNSAMKTVVMVGLVMGLHAVFYYMVFKGVQYDVKNLILYLPVSFSYILSMAFGYAGLRYIELSVASPISNSSGAVSALLTFFLLGGEMKWVQFVAVALISIGIILLSIVEKKAYDKELAENGEAISKKYRIGPLAIIFPILYCIIDGLGTFLDGYYLEFKQIMPEDQANISYELTFLIVAIVCWGYLEIVKKDSVIVFREKDKGWAAIFETIGQFFYIGAIATNAIVVAPMIASYSIVSIILSRIFLKEKLSRQQYYIIVLIMIAIAILGLYDI